jgi:hypothetical protein
VAKAVPVSMVMHVTQDDMTAATNWANGTNVVVRKEVVSCVSSASAITVRKGFP